MRRGTLSIPSTHAAKSHKVAGATRHELHNPWLAIDVATDPRARAEILRRAWERFLSGGTQDGGLREVITASWRRSAAAGARPTGHPEPPVMDSEDVRARWREHPLYRVAPLLRESLSEIATEAQHLLVVSDEEGRILSIDGDHRVRAAAAEEMGFAEGALWSEQGAGTNAIGTALAVRHAVQVFAAEHFNEIVQRWTCAAAPIRDPASGRVLGVIDLTGRLETVHPHSLALATATAEMVEAQMRCQQQEREARLRERYVERALRTPSRRTALVAADGRVLAAIPAGWTGSRVPVPVGGGELTLPDGGVAVAEALGRDGAYLLTAVRRRARRRPAVLALQALDRERALVRLDGRELRLSHRHTELLVLMALHPRGLTSEQLSLTLHGEEGRPSTVRAELSRLRKLLGDAIRSEPYRLALRLDADFDAVRALLVDGRVRDAAKRYPGPLLPRSEAPGIVEARDELDAWMRRCVLAAEDPEALWAWVRTSSGRDDLTAWKRLLVALDYGDPRCALAASRVSHLRERLAPSELRPAA